MAPHPADRALDDVAGLGVAIAPTTLPLGRLAGTGARHDDEGIVALAEGMELATVAAYEVAAASGVVTDPTVVAALGAFAGHHAEHARAFAALAGWSATGAPDPTLLAAVEAELAGAPDQEGVLRLALDLEHAAAATHLLALGALRTTTALALTASVLPVESQHIVVLGTLLGLPLAEIVPTFQSVDGAVEPDDGPGGRRAPRTRP